MKQLILIVFLFMITGCDLFKSSTKKNEISIEENTSIETEIPPKITGKFIDSIVIGLNYTCDGVNLLTNREGEFSCQNSPIIFSVGELILGELDEFTEDNKVYPQDILALERSDFTDENLIKLTRFIQSLDDDGNISISINIPSIMASTFIEKKNIKDLSITELESLLGRDLIDEESAIQHLKESMGVNFDMDSIREEASRIQDILNDDSTPYTTEAEFNQTEYAKNHLSDEESRKIVRMHNLVASAIDPDPEWFMTRVDKMVNVVQAGDNYVVHVNKVGRDNVILGPVDNEKLKFIVRIQRSKDDFEYVTNNNISNYVRWTDAGKLSMHVPDDLESGRLLIGLRPNFDDVGVKAIAERWSTMIIGEVWKVKDNVKVLKKDDVLFPVSEEIRLLNSNSKFNSEEIANKLKNQIKSNNPFMFPLVLTNLDVQKGDLLAYQLNGKPYSGRVFSVEKRDTQQFVFLTPEFFEVYNIMDAEEGFLRKEGLYPEHMSFREGESISTDSNESDPIKFSKKMNKLSKPSFLNFFKRNCQSGEASLIFSPSFSLHPFSASLQTSLKLGTPTAECSWSIDTDNSNLPKVSLNDYIPPFSPVAAVLIVLGAKTEIVPIGGLSLKANLGKGVGISMGVHSNKKTDFKFLGMDDSIFRIGSHNLTDKTSYQEFTSGLSAGAQVNFKILSYTEYKELYNENILNPNGAVFNDEELSFLPSLDISMSSSLKGSIGLNVANASSIYKDKKGSSMVFKIDSILSLKYSADIAKLIKFFTNFKLVVQSNLTTPIFEVKFPLTYTFDSVKDDGQGSAQILNLRPNLPPLFASFFSTPKGVIADITKESSIFNDEADNISYDVKECKNGHIESEVIACSSWICGTVEKKVKLCQTVTSTTINERTKVNETVRGNMTVKNHGEKVTIIINDNLFEIEEKGFITLENEEERKLTFSATCPSDDGVYRGQTRISNMLNSDLLVINSTLLCEKDNDECPDGDNCDNPPPPLPCTGSGCGNPPKPDDRLVGDPHIITSDGLGYNFFASGDYVLSRVEAMKDEYEIQGRFLPGFETSWPQAVAIKVGNDIVEVQSVRAQRASINGTTTAINSLKIWVNGQMSNVGTSKTDSSISRNILLPSGGNIQVQNTTSTNLLTFPSSIIITWPAESKAQHVGVIVSVVFEGDPFVDIDILKPSQTFEGEQRGLLGNDDGNPNNDFIRRNNEVLGEDHNLSFTELYGLFGTDWLVRPYESLFRNPEAIEPEFPSTTITLTPEQQAFGEEACVGLIGFYYESCVLDVGLTGSTTLIEEYYSNTEDLNSFSEQIIEPDVDRAFYNMNMLKKEKFSDTDLSYTHYKQKISITKKSGEGKFILLVRPPRGATAELETGKGSYLGEGDFNTSITLNCQELNEETNKQIYLKDGVLQLWSQDKLSGTLGHLYEEVKLSCNSQLDGLIAHWSFDDCTAKDNSENGRDGIIHGNMECVDGIYGKAFKFDGNNDGISMNLPLDGKNNWSMCTWFNIESNEQRYQTFLSNSDFALDLYMPDLNYAVWQGSKILSLGQIEEKKDTFVCYTKKEDNLTVYHNAIKVGEPSNGSSIEFNQLTQIGRYANETEVFNGLLDEMKVYNRSLSNDEIEYLYKLDGKRPFLFLGKDKVILEGQEVTFDINDSSNDIVKYEWKEGNNILSEDSSFTSSNFTTGMHLIRLTVTTSEGKTRESSIELIVESSKILEVHDVYNSKGNFIKKLDTFYLNGTYEHDILLKSGTVIIDKNTTIDGDLIQSGGVLSINEKNLIIKGDYRLQTPEENGTYTSSRGRLIMTTRKDYLLVEGDFVTDSEIRQFTSLTAGVLELKGHFTQMSTNPAYDADGKYNFTPEQDHVVKFSGNKQQIVTFEDILYTNWSRFGTVELHNLSTSGVLFKRGVAITKLFNHHNNVFSIGDSNASTFQDFDSDGVEDNFDQYPTDSDKTGVPPNTMRLIIPFESITIKQLEQKQFDFSIGHSLLQDLDVLLDLNDTSLANLSNSWKNRTILERYYKDNNLTIKIEAKDTIGKGNIIVKITDEYNNELIREVPLIIVDEE